MTDPMYFEMQQRLLEKHEAEKEGINYGLFEWTNQRKLIICNSKMRLINSFQVYKLVTCIPWLE